MAIVRAKFVLQSYETFMSNTYPHHKADGSTDYSKPEQLEVRNLKFGVVQSGSEENKAFFASTPSGTIILSTVNRAAWQQFELNKEYYIDFERAE